MSNPDKVEPEIRAIDRFLSFASLVVIVLAFVCFVAVIVGTAVGVQDFSTPLWQTIFAVMYFGLPLGAVMFFAVIIMNMVRRSRLNKPQKR